MTSESGGKLTMTPSLGDATAITSGVANKVTGATRNASTNSNSSQFLGNSNSFEIHGIYDMSSLPSITGETFGIRATDRALNLGNDGDNTIYLAVGMSTTNQIVVLAHIFDFSANTITLVDSISISGVLATADHIDLNLSKAAGTDKVDASFRLYDASNTLIVEESIVDSLSLMEIYKGEDYIRAQFLSSDLVTVPEPSSLALFGSCLVSLVFMRRRRRSV